jgi:hypothetical protein
MMHKAIGKNLFASFENGCLVLYEHTDYYKRLVTIAPDEFENLINFIREEAFTPTTNEKVNT